MDQPIMKRARREIKTPKRFDEEPFETTRRNSGQHAKQQQQQQQQLQPVAPAPADSSPEPVVKVAPEQTPSKNIIKVKLTKSRNRESLPPPPAPKAQAAAKVAPTSRGQTSAKTPSVPKLQPSKSPPSRPSSPPAAPSKLKQEPTQSLPPPPPPQLQPQTPTVAAPAPVYQQVTNIPIVRRPKIRRPRTPPAYANLMPNLVLPFWDARTAAEDHEDDNVKELVHCQCGIAEEVDLMVQCETCLTWQHAHCLGIEKPEDAPDGYTCKACCDPKFARESMRWAYDQDWLLRGRMKRFASCRESTNDNDVDILNRINRLIDNSLKIYQLVHSLRIKSRLLKEASDDNPELKLFRNQWPASYQHFDGRPFVPSLDYLPSFAPALSLSAMAETPDPGDIPVETVAQATLPDLGQLEDVSAILDNTDIPNTSMPSMVGNHEATPDDCRANLKLHIQQTEDFLRIETACIDKQLEALEKESATRTVKGSHNLFESLRNDLNVIRNYMSRTRKR